MQHPHRSISADIVELDGRQTRSSHNGSLQHCTTVGAMHGVNLTLLSKQLDKTCVLHRRHGRRRQPAAGAGWRGSNRWSWRGPGEHRPREAVSSVAGSHANRNPVLMFTCSRASCGGPWAAAVSSELCLSAASQSLCPASSFSFTCIPTGGRSRRQRLEATKWSPCGRTSTARASSGGTRSTARQTMSIRCYHVHTSAGLLLLHSVSAGQQLGNGPSMH
jgi:hypothetical protein